MDRTVWAIWGTRSAGGVPTRAAISSSLGNSAVDAMAPTMATLETDLMASAAALGPSRFLAPEAGLMRLGSGLRAPKVGLKPTWPVAAARPASAHTPIT